MNEQFSKKELHAITTGLQFSDRPIYYREITPTAYCVVANALPDGKYVVHFADELDTVRAFNRFTTWKNVTPTLTDSTTLSLNIQNLASISFAVESNADQIVMDLRKQFILKSHDKRRLIKSCVDEIERANKTKMDEQFNRDSLYDTIQECLDYDIPLNVDETKPMSDCDVRYLRAMKLLQDAKFINAKQDALNLEKAELKRRQNEFLKF